MSAPAPAIPGVYRLVSTALATGVHISASGNDNITFNTNIPSLDFAIRIWRTRLISGFSAFSGLVTGDSAPLDVQLFGQLTENQTKTSILTTDTSYLDEYWQHILIGNVKDTAAGFVAPPPSNLPMEVIHDFPPHITPYTVATKLNFVVTSVANAAGEGTTIWKPLIAIEYTLERLTADLRDYLAKRLQIQGS